MQRWHTVYRASFACIIFTYTLPGPKMFMQYIFLCYKIFINVPGCKRHSFTRIKKIPRLLFWNTPSILSDWKTHLKINGLREDFALKVTWKYTSHNVKEEVRDVHVNLCKKSTFVLVNCNFDGICNVASVNELSKSYMYLF